MEIMMKTVSIKLPDTLDSRLSVFIRKRKVSKSAVIREALEAYLARESEAAPNSFLEAARDLCGHVDGPVDLSTSPKHLDGYGQ
jgi:Arc/MetJ-type ribon-helix-helix transcriptional regulator